MYLCKSIPVSGNFLLTVMQRGAAAVNDLVHAFVCSPNDEGQILEHLRREAGKRGDFRFLRLLHRPGLVLKESLISEVLLHRLLGIEPSLIAQELTDAVSGQAGRKGAGIVDALLALIESRPYKEWIETS